MKKYIQKLFVGSLMAGTLLVSSCASDYLDTAPTDSTGSADAIGTTDNAIKALNGIAKLISTQQYYFGQGIAEENKIIQTAYTFEQTKAYEAPELAKEDR